MITPTIMFDHTKIVGILVVANFSGKILSEINKYMKGLIKGVF